MLALLLAHHILPVSRTRVNASFIVFITTNKYKIIHHNSFSLHRVIHEESAKLWEMIVCVILSKKVHINMGPILHGYGVMTA